ncbi:MAG: hypothetical protein K0R55_454 [Sporomusa sp.]|jgi:hypothetical protein|nr:hypothetical protein [Sporomusa sp.]
MGKVVILDRIEPSGIFILPQGLTFEVVDVILLNGIPVKDGKYAAVSNGAAIDVFESNLRSVVSVILK